MSKKFLGIFARTARNDNFQRFNCVALDAKPTIPTIVYCTAVRALVGSLVRSRRDLFGVLRGITHQANVAQLHPCNGHP